MKVVISYEDGSYFLIQFRPGYGPEAYEAPPEWESQAVMVPDHVVVAWAALTQQVASMETLLGLFDEKRETS